MPGLQAVSITSQIAFPVPVCKMMLPIAAGRRLLPGPRAMLPCPASRPVMLQSNFLGRSVLKSRCSVPGFSVVAPLQLGQSGHRRPLTVEAHGNSKRSLGDTKHGTRRHRTRTSGFRTRRLTVGGRKVLAARRKRGRKTLCPANSRTNKKSTASSDRR